MNREKQKLVPKLRFPEFEKDGAWELTTIGDIGKFYYGKSAPKWSLSKDAPTLCVRYGELYTKFGTIIKEVFSRTNIDPKTLRFSKGGEILIPRVGEDPFAFANCSYLPFPNIAIGEMISVYETKQNSIFYTYYFNTLHKQFARVVEGQNVKNLYYINLEPINIGKPNSKEEQQKIANCLSSLDDLIGAETEKLTLLKDHKRGVLQQLFSTRAETQPQYRLPEFEKNEGWITKPLKKVFSIFQGYAFSSRDSAENGARWLKIADVSIQKMNPNNPSFLPAEYIGTYDKFLIKKGDYVLALTRPILNGKLKISAVDDLFHNSLLNQRVGKLISNENLALVYYLLQTHYLIGEIEKSIAGSEPPNLSMKQIENIPISIPKDPKEQQKIADFLSSLDEIIESQTQKIEALKEHKKGLMQQLFPNLNNVAL